MHPPLPLTTLLLLLSIHPSASKVVNSLNLCQGFIKDETPPHIPKILEKGVNKNQNRYKVVCQTLNGENTFVTLYDTKNKIPVFSAFKYKGHNPPRPNNPWAIEPQLEDPQRDDNMVSEDPTIEYKYQAVKKNYRNKNTGETKYDKGHLLPCSYGLTENEKKSTFSLTNIVPQVSEFNQGSWSRMEKCVKCVLDKYCINSNSRMEGYVVIGAMPSGIDKPDEVDIPSQMWSAFCCYNRNQKTWYAGAHWGKNQASQYKYLYTRTLQELHKELQIQPFPQRDCLSASGVTTFYPTLDKKCECPPPEPPVLDTADKSWLSWALEGLWTSMKFVGTFSVDRWNEVKAGVAEYVTNWWNGRPPNS